MSRKLKERRLDCLMSLHDKSKSHSDRDALRAGMQALAVTISSPVAWRYRFVTSVDGLDWSDWFVVHEENSVPRIQGRVQVVEPLYTFALTELAR